MRLSHGILEKSRSENTLPIGWLERIVFKDAIYVDNDTCDF
jgi:hypothetical protein